MSTRALCKHDLDPATCADCSGDLRVRRPHPVSEIRACYGGRCSGCGEPIYVGDPIRPAAGEDGWLGECCT